ncbi:Tat pathway signal sequence domain protein, partial [Paraburkholderia sp. SIMBA_055]
ATDLALTADGETRPAQFWPLATWPDGSVKWAGVAVPASPFAAASITVGDNPAPESPVSVGDADDAVTVDNGLLTLVVPRRGSALFSSLSRRGTVVAENGRLVSALADGPSSRDARTDLAGVTDTVTVEQTGPVRAVIRVDGHHAA